jgi:hypothetical protein
MNTSSDVGQVVTAFVAELTEHAVGDLPSAEDSGDEWFAVLRNWLSLHGCDLVSVAVPGRFQWPGHWIGIVELPGSVAGAAGVLLFGSPSAVIASPADPFLVGKSVEELRFHMGLLIVPFQPFARSAAHDRDVAGEVVGIYVSEVKMGPMQPCTAATAVAGRGLSGDRYAVGAGTFTPKSNRMRGYELTLIESEALDRMTLPDRSHLTAAESRRNVITRGIELNGLVGHEFTIGAVHAVGRRLCEPCAHLQRLTRPGVVAGLIHRGGLRADILTDGEIHLGDAVTDAGTRLR